ncbi:hypothetical protein KP509_13G048200 [Ceratopteris richardii]|nr:hypothetical protein KP509_13G048200 [Ceratopteris richardii]
MGTFYVEGEVSLYWDRETGEVVSLLMNSTLLPDHLVDTHLPPGSSFASSSFPNNFLDHVDADGNPLSTVFSEVAIPYNHGLDCSSTTASPSYVDAPHSKMMTSSLITCKLSNEPKNDLKSSILALAEPHMLSMAKYMCPFRKKCSTTSSSLSSPSDCELECAESARASSEVAPHIVSSGDITRQSCTLGLSSSGVEVDTSVKPLLNVIKQASMGQSISSVTDEPCLPTKNVHNPAISDHYSSKVSCSSSSIRDHEYFEPSLLIQNRRPSCEIELIDTESVDSSDGSVLRKKQLWGDSLDRAVKNSGKDQVQIKSTHAASHSTEAGLQSILENYVEPHPFDKGKLKEKLPATSAQATHSQASAQKVANNAREFVSPVVDNKSPLLSFDVGPITTSMVLSVTDNLANISETEISTTKLPFIGSNVTLWGGNNIVNNAGETDAPAIAGSNAHHFLSAMKPTVSATVLQNPDQVEKHIQNPGSPLSVSSDIVDGVSGCPSGNEKVVNNIRKVNGPATDDNAQPFLSNMEPKPIVITDLKYKIDPEIHIAKLSIVEDNVPSVPACGVRIESNTSNIDVPTHANSITQVFSSAMETTVDPTVSSKQIDNIVLETSHDWKACKKPRKGDNLEVKSLLDYHSFSHDIGKDLPESLSITTLGESHSLENKSLMDVECSSKKYTLSENNINSCSLPQEASRNSINGLDKCSKDMGHYSSSKPKLSPWFSTPYALSETPWCSLSSDALSDPISIFERLPSGDMNSSSDACSSNQRNKHEVPKEPSTLKPENPRSSHCSSDNHSSHFLRSLCKNGHCRADSITSTSGSSSCPGSGKISKKGLKLSTPNDKVVPNVSSHLKESNDPLVSAKASNSISRMRRGNVEPQHFSMEFSGSPSHVAPKDEDNFDTLMDENEDCTSAVTIVNGPSPQSSFKHSSTQHAKSQSLKNTENEVSSLEKITEKLKLTNEKMSRNKKAPLTDSKKKSKRKFSSPNSSNSEAISKSCNERTASLSLDREVPPCIGSSSFIGQKRTSLDALIDMPSECTSNLDSLHVSSPEDTKPLLTDPVEEKPVISINPIDYANFFGLASLPDSAEEKPNLLNTNPKNLLDYANKLLPFRIELNKSDFSHPPDIPQLRDTVMGKQYRDHELDPLASPIQATVKDTVMYPSSKNLPIKQKQSSIKEKSYWSPQVTASNSPQKTTKRLRIGDFSNNTQLDAKKNSLWATKEEPVEESSPYQQKKTRKRSLESDSPHISSKHNVISLLQQPALPCSNHASCSTDSCMRNLEWSTTDNQKNKRRKIFYPLLRPIGCCRPRNAFIFFSMTERQRVAAAHPHSDFGEISKLVALSWHNMSDGDKKPYRMLALEDANRYYNYVSRTHQNWERLTARGLQILYIMDIFCDWLSQKLPRWVKYLSASSVDSSHE